jgi:hypothetical protein
MKSRWMLNNFEDAFQHLDLKSRATPSQLWKFISFVKSWRVPAFCVRAPQSTSTISHDTIPRYRPPPSQHLPFPFHSYFRPRSEVPIPSPSLVLSAYSRPPRPHAIMDSAKLAKMQASVRIGKYAYRRLVTAFPSGDDDGCSNSG